MCQKISTYIVHFKGFKKCGVLPQHKTRAVQYSASATVCERCGVEDTNMGSCRLCQKVS